MFIGKNADIDIAFCQHQNLPPFRETTYEWAALEFGYYALLASVLHLKQRVVQDRSLREDCLRASRQALIRLAKLQDEIYINANFLDEYPYFLTWSALACNMMEQFISNFLQDTTVLPT